MILTFHSRTPSRLRSSAQLSCMPSEAILCRRVLHPHVSIARSTYTVSMTFKLILRLCGDIEYRFGG